jgi:integrator complex subunit 7
LSFCSDNFMRHRILQSTKLVQQHLHKIGNLDEVLHRFNSVLRSTDPVARALTLRVLANFVAVAPERKDTHHSIREALGSTVPSEVRAAVHAADRLCESSPSFASTLTTQVASLVYALETPLELKLELVALIRHFHHDAAGVASGVQLCRMLLRAFPARAMVLALLTSATNLVTVSQIGVANHITFLLEHLHGDPRASVKAAALKGLLRLARRAPLCWNTPSLASVTTFIHASPVPHLICDGLRIIAALIDSAAGSALVAELLLADESNAGTDGAFAALQALSGHPNAEVAIWSAMVLSRIGSAAVLPASCAAERSRLVEAACEAVATSISCWVVLPAAPAPALPADGSTVSMTVDAANDDADAGLADDSNGRPPPVAMLKELLDCPSRLATVSVPAGAVLTDLLVSQLTSLTAGPLDVVVGQSLQRILTWGCSEGVDPVPGLLNIVRSSAHRVEAKVEAAVAAIMGSRRSSSGGSGDGGGKSAIDESIAAAIDELAAQGEFWAVHRIARQAASLGSHHIASRAFRAVQERPCSEHYAFWLSGVTQLCAAEQSCSNEGRSSGGSNPHKEVAIAQQLSAATTQFHAALILLKAAVQATCEHKFQLDYVDFRIEMTATLLDVVKCIGSLLRRGGATQDVAGPCFDRLHRLLSQCVALERKYFDIDIASMLLIDTLRDALAGLAYAFGRLLVPASVGKLTPQLLPLGGAAGAGESAVPPTAPTRTDGEAIMTSAVQQLLGKVDAMAVAPSSAAGSQTARPESLRWLQGIVAQLAGAPQPVPRFFFWNGEPTTVQMFLTQESDGAVAVPSETDFVLVVEGVVRAGGPAWKGSGGVRTSAGKRAGAGGPDASRTVTQVVLEVNVMQHTSSGGGTETGLSVRPTVTREVAVHRSSFRTTFVVRLPAQTKGMSVIYEASVRANLLDGYNRLWTTDAKSTVTLTHASDGTQGR